jgi:hypothetical protein
MAKAAGGTGAGAIVNKHVAAGREQLAAGSETYTLGAGSDEGAFAVEFMHAKSEDALWIFAMISQRRDG